MTAEEFLKKRYPAGLPISTQQWEDDMPEIMEAYAEHLDQTAWVSVEDELPPIDPDWDLQGFSENVLVIDGDKNAIGYFVFREKVWLNSEDDKSIRVTHWRPLPTPPTK